MERKRFLTNCVSHHSGDEINEMKDASQDITYATFRKHVDLEDLKALTHLFGYRRGEKLQLHTDWSVSFSKSKFQGKPCYYFTWSAIEYIFV